MRQHRLRKTVIATATPLAGVVIVFMVSTSRACNAGNKHMESQVSYNITKQEYGRTRHEIDLVRFTADLAKALGGSVLAAEHGEHRIAFDGFKISLSDGYRVSERGKAILGIRELDWKWLGSDE